MTAPYRDDFDASQERLFEVEQKLDAIRKEAERLEGLKQEQAEAEREARALRQKLDEMTRKRSLPLLDNLRIASPCNEDWEKMTGDDRVRHCAACDKDVYNLSVMARADAERLLRERLGGICVRLYKRADGTVITSDCPVGLKKKRIRRLAYGALGGGALTAAGALSLFTTQGKPAHAVMNGAPDIGPINVVEPIVEDEGPLMPMMGVAPLQLDVKPPQGRVTMGKPRYTPPQEGTHPPKKGR